MYSAKIRINEMHFYVKLSQVPIHDKDHSTVSRFFQWNRN